MGQVLSQPISNQLVQRRGNEHFMVTSSEMQGFRTNMEDTHTIALSLGEKHPNTAFFGVYDGHAGEKASIFLEKHLYTRIAALEDPTDPAQLTAAVVAFDQEFTSREADREDGSTCTFAVVRPVHKQGMKIWEITVANVGDSRIMIIRKDGTVVGLTEDHKPETPSESRRITQAGGTVQMNRVDGQLAMSRAIGDWQYKANPNLGLEQQKVIPVPDITKAEAQEGDVLVLCCDGIVEQMTNEDAAACVYQRLNNNEDPAEVLAALFQLSLDKGSKDNHSAMIVQLKDGSAYNAADEFRAGPYHPYKNDKAFAKAYLADARKHGYEGERLFQLARQTEERLNLPDHPVDNHNNMAGLSAFLPPNAPPELRAMFASMLSQGAEVMDDEEDEEEAEEVKKPKGKGKGKNKPKSKGKGKGKKPKSEEEEPEDQEEEDGLEGLEEDGMDELFAQPAKPAKGATVELIEEEEHKEIKVSADGSVTVSSDSTRTKIVKPAAAAAAAPAATAATAAAAPTSAAAPEKMSAKKKKAKGNKKRKAKKKAN